MLHVLPLLWSWIFISQPSSNHPPISRITIAHTTVPSWLKQSFISFRSRLLIQTHGAWKIDSSVGGLNPRRLSPESSALTTRITPTDLICCISYFYRFGIIPALKSIADIAKDEEIFVNYNYRSFFAPKWYKDLLTKENV
jgi:hypothetical protein